MKYNIDKEYLLGCLRDIIAVPSPVGYYVKINPLLEEYAAKLGHTVTYDNRKTAYITLDGEDNSKTVVIGAHADTLGMMVHKIDGNGMIRIRAIGGINFSSIEGETVTVHTRDGREYTGLMTVTSHSTHVFDDARSMPRDENHMMIILDEKVKTAAEVRELGIRPGDYVSVDPRFQVTEKGFVKSRYLDDKAAVACVYTMLKYLGDNNIKPKNRTILAFPHMEEVGFGGAFVPSEACEYVALDIGLIGPDLDGTEFGVSICAKDVYAPYDYDLTNKLIGIAEDNDIPYAVDLFFRYSTDANAAVRGGNDLRAAAFGMAVYCSHGMERTHIEGLDATVNLLIGYVLS